MNDSRKGLDKAIARFNSFGIAKEHALSKFEINELTADFEAIRSEETEQKAIEMLIKKAFKLGWYAARYGERVYDKE